MPLNRRSFLAASAALPHGLRAMSQPTQAPARWLFLGTDKGQGIYRASWDPATGTLGKPELAAATDRPNFFALHPALPVLYTVNEMSGEKASLSAYTLDRPTGSLSLLGRAPTHGDSPCFLALDANGRVAFTANYSSGSLSCFRLSSNGTPSLSRVSNNNGDAPHGPVADRQDASHLHCTTLSPDNHFVLVCDLGQDEILTVRYDPAYAPAGNGYVLSNPGPNFQAVGRTKARPGSGPRHVVFHPNGRWLYCIHELDCTVDLYDWKISAGEPSLTLRPGSVVSTLGPGDPPANNAIPEPAKPSTGCEVLVSPDGRFLYTCTRGADTLVTFRIDPNTGLLTEHQRLRCGDPKQPQIPRIIAFDPTRRWLLSCNQASSTVTVFAHDPATGHLDPSFRSFSADTPMFALWV